MNLNTLPGPGADLGDFLRERRARLRPAPGAPGRRRTPGLRREEVAARAGVSVTWYTWLEQGRGGPPSAELLERLCRALELDADSREILFLLAQNRPPPVSHAPPSEAVSPAVQRVLDALVDSPALVKTPAWDIVAWNAAARAVFGYDEGGPAERNLLRRLFTHPDMRAHLPDWEENARFAIAVFRIDAARAGAGSEAAAIASQLLAVSPEFRRLWAQSEPRSHGVGRKRMVHPTAGALGFEVSAFAVLGAEGLTMMVFTPSTAQDAVVVARLTAAGG